MSFGLARIQGHINVHMHLHNLSRADFLGLGRGGVVHGASVRRAALHPRSDGLLGRAVRHIHLFLRFCQYTIY